MFERLELEDLNFSIELGFKSKGKAVIDANGDMLDADCDENFSCAYDTVGVPSKTDWANARRFVSFLCHFYTLTVRISGSKYVTLNTFFYTEISEVLYLLKEWHKGKDKDMVAVAAKMKQKYDNYWEDIQKMNMLIYVAVVLDPRHKLDYVRWTLLKIYKSSDKNKKDVAMKLVEMVKDALQDMFNEYMQMDNCVIEGPKAQKKELQLLSHKLMWRVLRVLLNGILNL